MLNEGHEEKKWKEEGERGGRVEGEYESNEEQDKSKRWRRRKKDGEMK